MSCYISSNNNRAFVALESTYGTVATVTGENRIPLIKLAARQTPVTSKRRDKTGSRTFYRAAESSTQRHYVPVEHVHDKLGRTRLQHLAMDHYSKLRWVVLR